MANINHPDMAGSLEELIASAVNKGVAHINIENEVLDGRHVTINGSEVINFGSYSYLGLELHPAIKAGVIQAVNNQGASFPSTRAYLSSSLYVELENLLAQVFESPVIVSQSTTLGHSSLVPVILGSKDLVIMDHQVHYTVQMAVKVAEANGTTSMMVRHNRMDLLEEKIKENASHYERIWYFADGIYSMYGDFAPLTEIVTLLDKYDNFHAYLDDAHGMSWTGKHGRGWVLDTIDLHPKMMVALSLSKAYGVTGGVLVFPNEADKRRVRILGGNLIFTGPISPPELGGAIASAKIHLSDEIYRLQNDLKAKVRYFKERLAQTQMLVVSNSDTPIFYIGMGLPRVGMNMVKRVMDSGFYVNIAMYPAVPIKCTGVRISINTHLTYEDLDGLVAALEYHYPQVLAEENITESQIHKAFHKVLPSNSPVYTPLPE